MNLPSGPATASSALDLAAYLARVDYRGDLSPDLATLDALHLAHATHIPFENLDILLGRPPRLDLASLEAKLVGARRGGYCFEQNMLFAAVLETIGFSVRRLAARVRYRTLQLLPRTHMLLQVDVLGAPWLADVGFGAEGLVRPVPIAAGEAVRHGVWSYRVAREGDTHVLQSQFRGEWHDLYAFTQEAQDDVDFALANHYTSTHPDSRFVRTLTVQLPGLAQRTTLRDRELTIEDGTRTTTTTIGDDDALLAVLASRFGIDLPPGTRFGAPVEPQRPCDAGFTG